MLSIPIRKKKTVLKRRNMVTAVLSSEENQPAQEYVNAERKK